MSAFIFIFLYSLNFSNAGALSAGSHEDHHLPHAAVSTVNFDYLHCTPVQEQPTTA
jgi:hypothetical protein